MQSKLLSSSSRLPETCRSLFLGDLSCFCQENDITRVFSQFGAIDEIRLKRNADGNGLGYGFVTFVDVKSAEAASLADGLLILGRPVKISWANARITAGGNRKAPTINNTTFQHIPKPKSKPVTADTVTTAQLHFSFISKGQYQLVTEETVRQVFLTFGFVQDVSIKKTSTNPKTGEQTGYGFVHFPLTDAGIHSAICGSKIIRHTLINQVLYDCRLTWSLEEIIRRKQVQEDMSMYYNQPPRHADHNLNSTKNRNFVDYHVTSMNPIKGPSDYYCNLPSSDKDVRHSFLVPDNKPITSMHSAFLIQDRSSFTTGISTPSSLSLSSSFSSKLSHEDADNDVWKSSPASSPHTMEQQMNFQFSFSFDNENEQFNYISYR